MFVFLTPRPPIAPRLGDEISIGLTAGRGSEGAGEAERRIDGEEPNEERRLCDTAGGSIGNEAVMGVPGFDGTGEPTERDVFAFEIDLAPLSGGAGLFDDMRRAGRSILWNFPCVVRLN